MESWKKFANTLDLTKDLEETYTIIRKIFQREGWSDDDLIKPPYYPNDLMKKFQKFSDQRDELFQTIRDYGFNVDNLSVTSYIQGKLKHIDEITPLN
jgi:hypothetical protein